MTRLATSHRTFSVVAALGLCATVFVSHAADTAYPTRPVRMVVPFAPGGGADTTARIIAPKMTELMGQQWEVDNRSGAGGNLASEIVVRATPDGYTVLLALDSQLTANPSLYTLPFNVEKDLQPVVIIAATDQIVVVHPGVPAGTFKEFVALAKSKPGAFRYGSGGVGSSNQLAAELIKKVVGIDIVHVPYKGAGPSIVGILAGEIQMNVSSPASTVGFVTSGKLRALARTGLKRGKVLPDVPTIAESGYPGFEALQWYGFVVPAATPRNVVARIRDDTLKALQSADVQSNMERLGLEPDGTRGAELAARLKAETAKWAAIIKDVGIRLQ
jgi:tripartite-type tricarboxylate transporter receptor subunit TctC